MRTQADHVEADVTVSAPAARDAIRRPGRPRSERAEQAILDATLEAIGDYGVDGVRCEDVAARAGVGKATLYRRWPGKEDLLIAAFASLKTPLPQVHGEGQRYPRLVARYKEQVVEPRRELIRSALRRGIASGELRPDTDVEIAMLTLTGAVMARGKHDGTPAEPGFAARVVDELMRGIAAR